MIDRLCRFADIDLDLAEQGLRLYVQRVATAVGTESTAACCEVAETATAYLALGDRLDRFPGRDVALVWDDRHGWAFGVETHSGEDMVMVAYYGPDLLPPPEDVATFAKTLIVGQPAGQPHPPQPHAGALQAELASHAAD